MVIRLVQHEPLVLYGDPASFAAIQMLVYLFYLVPIQGISLLFSLKTAKPQFLWELTLLQAGALLQVSESSEFKENFRIMHECRDTPNP